MGVLRVGRVRVGGVSGVVGQGEGCRVGIEGVGCRVEGAGVFQHLWADQVSVFVPFFLAEAHYLRFHG